MNVKKQEYIDLSYSSLKGKINTSLRKTPKKGLSIAGQENNVNIMVDRSRKEMSRTSQEIRDRKV